MSAREIVIEMLERMPEDVSLHDIARKITQAAQTHPAPEAPHIDLSKLGTLQSRIPEDFPPFDLQQWRDAPKEYVSLRD